MGAQDVLRVHEAAPQAPIVTVHMEWLNDCTETRAEVRDLAREHGIAERVLVPEDGAVSRLTGFRSVEGCLATRSPTLPGTFS
jgi:hypothetical protein